MNCPYRNALHPQIKCHEVLEKLLLNRGLDGPQNQGQQGGQ